MGGRRKGVEEDWERDWAIGSLSNCGFLVLSFREEGLFKFGTDSRSFCRGEPGYCEWIDIDVSFKYVAFSRIIELIYVAFIQTLHFVGNFPESAEVFGIISDKVCHFLREQQSQLSLPLTSIA